MNFILLGTSTTPTGRGLLQEDDELFVLTACCTAKYTDSASGICSDCGKKDGKAARWRTTISLTENWIDEQRHWSGWALDLFGYENFELHVSERRE